MAETTQLVDEHPAERAGTRFPTRASRRVRLAQALASVALLAALLGALGPAEHLRTKYSWPPKPLPVATPSKAWYTPLLLIRHEPEAISARLPCALPRALPAAATPVTVLATARLPRANGGLAVTRVRDQLVVRVGDKTITRVGLPSRPTGDRQCAYVLRIADDRWSIEGGPSNVADEGALERRPIVSGLFSELDLGTGAPLAIDVTTAVHAARTTVRQAIAWAVAILALVAALLLVAVEGRPRWSWVAATSLVRRAIGQARPADAVVAAVLLGWWVIAPAFYDDGWVIARQTEFSTTRGFSNYYNVLGTNLPNGYWLEWAQHWLTQSSSALLILRVPALLCLAATWILCRWVLARALAPFPGRDRTALWALTSGFLVGALAWGMTLRPEPATALLVTGVLACMVRFVERETVAPVAVAAVLVPLAVTGHHAGVVSLAPVLVVAPKLVPWARRQLPAAATIVVATAALFAVLAFVGSDAGQRRTDAQAARAFASSPASWHNEAVRYANLLLDTQYSTPLRRASVALIGLAVLAFVMRRRRAGRALLDIPATTLAVGLFLLIATPSKWAWHFGALLGIAALAVAAETARLRDEAARSPGWRAWPFLAIGVAIVAAAWSWSPRNSWGLLDLRTLDWTLGLERWLPISTLAVALPLLLLVGATLVAVTRGRRRQAREIPWRVASWTAAALAAPLIAFTAAILVADTAKTSSWTLARQNIETLWANPGCGLADDVLVADQKSMRPLLLAEASAGTSTPAWVPPAPVQNLPRFALGPAGEGSATSPWFHLPSRRGIGLFFAGSLGPSDSLELAWGRFRRDRIDRLAADQVSVKFTPEQSGSASWRFLAAGELPPRAPGATVVRTTLRGGTAPGATVAVTAPVTYTNGELVKRLDRGGSVTLVNPGLLAYFPCAKQPQLSRGAVEVPRQIVRPTNDPTWSVTYRVTNPFAGLLDLYRVEQLPLTDSRNPLANVAVFEIEQLIPGAKLAPPTRVTLTS